MYCEVLTFLDDNVNDDIFPFINCPIEFFVILSLPPSTSHVLSAPPPFLVNLFSFFFLENKNASYIIAMAMNCNNNVNKTVFKKKKEIEKLRVWAPDLFCA